MSEPKQSPWIEVGLRVPGMNGRQLVRLVTARLVDLPGVELVRADGATGIVVVQGAVSEEELRVALADLGLPASHSEVMRAVARRQG